MAERLDIEVGERGARVVRRNIHDVGRAANGVTTQVQLLTRVLALIGGTAALRQLVSLADTFTDIQNRLRTVTDGTEQLTAATQGLFAIANRTRSSFEATAEVFARVGLAARDLGVSQQTLLQFTESLNQAVILSGASATEAQAGLIQLSQGLASGALRGDELNSVLEQLPVVADVISDSLGVTRGQLRKMGQEGKITAQIVLEAFAAAREELATRFGESIPTVSQSLTVLRNNFIGFIGEADQANGVTRLLSQRILGLAENLDTLATTGTAVAIVFASRYVQAQHASIAASLNNARATRAALAAEVERTATIRNLRLWQLEQARVTARGVAATDLAAAANIRATAATRAHAAAQAQYAAATRASAIATRGLTATMGVLGGPLGLITLAGFALYAFADANDEAAGSVEGLTDNLDAFRRSLEDLSRSELQAELVRQLKQLEEARARADETLLELTGRGAVGLLVAGVAIVEDVVSATASIVKDAVDFVEQLPEHLINQPQRLADEDDEVAKRGRQIVELERALMRAPGAGAAPTPIPSQVGTGVAGVDGEQADAINKVIEALEFEIAQLNRSAEAQAVYNNLRRAGNDVDADTAQRIRALTLELVRLDKEQGNARAQEEQRTAALEAQLDAQEALAQSEINTNNAALDFLASQREQIENFGKSRIELAALNAEKRVAGTLDETKIQRARENAIELENLRIAREEETRASQERHRALEKEQQQIDDLATALASNLTSSFEGAVFAGESFGNVLTGLADDMARLIFRITVLEPLTHSLAEAFGRGSSGGGLVGFLTSLAGGVGRGLAGGASSSFSLGGSDPLGLSGLDPADVIRLDLEALKFQTGGLLPGAFGAGPDSVLARLTPGEFVVNAQATRAYLPLLEALNDAPAFQHGGRVDASAFQLPAGTAPSAAPNIYINVTNPVPGVEVEAQARPPSGPRGDQVIDVMIMESLGRGQRNGQLNELLASFGVQQRLKDRR